MSDDWKSGDLALCQTSIFDKPGDETWWPREGRTYIVNTVFIAPDGVLALSFIEEPPGQPFAENGWDAAFFRKVRPHTPDAEDRETIKLLTGKPVKEPVA